MVREVNERNNTSCRSISIAGGTPPQTRLPDLRVSLAVPGRAIAGSNIGPAVRLVAANTGNALALGTDRARANGYMIDLILSRDTRVPNGFATFSPNWREDVLLRGGRVSNTRTLAPRQSQAYRVGGGIPANTPPGRYFVCARVDSGNKIRELSERNNVACRPIVILRRR